MLTPLPKKVAGMAVVFDPNEKRALLERVKAIADSGFFLWGDQQEEFERRFAELTARRFAKVFSSTTSSLEFLLRRLVAAKGDRELTIGFQGNAFPSVVFAARRVGARAVFADLNVGKGLLNGDGQRVEDAAPGVAEWAALAERYPLDVIVHQHTGGSISAEWQVIAAWAKGLGIFVIEDSSQAAGSFGNLGVRAGGLGDVAFFSTSATKALHTGQGSVMVTDDPKIAEAMTQIRQYGRTQMFQAGEFVQEGGNISQSEMNAAVGNVMLDTLQSRIDYRTRIADLFSQRLGDLLTFVAKSGKPNWYKQMAILPAYLPRAAFKEKLLKEGNVQLGSEVYDFVTPQLKVFGGEYDDQPVPNTVAWAATHVCMPLHNVITSGEAEQVIEQVRQAAHEVAAVTA